MHSATINKELLSIQELLIVHDLHKDLLPPLEQIQIPVVGRGQNELGFVLFIPSEAQQLEHRHHALDIWIFRLQFLCGNGLVFHIERFLQYIARRLIWTRKSERESM